MEQDIINLTDTESKTTETGTFTFKRLQIYQFCSIFCTALSDNFSILFSGTDENKTHNTLSDFHA